MCSPRGKEPWRRWCKIKIKLNTCCGPMLVSWLTGSSELPRRCAGKHTQRDPVRTLSASSHVLTSIEHRFRDFIANTSFL